MILVDLEWTGCEIVNRIISWLSSLKTRKLNNTSSFPTFHKCNKKFCGNIQAFPLACFTASYTSCPAASCLQNICNDDALFLSTM